MRLGLITGSGSYALPALEGVEPEPVPTRFGPVPVAVGTFAGIEVVHVPRHRAHHVLLSSAVTHQANVTALRELGVDAVLATTACGACDPSLALGSLIVFDDLFFPQNRLPDGSLCTLHTTPGAPGRGHWIFDEPYSPPLRAALLAGARATGTPVRDGGTYGHVDGPRFNTKLEIRVLASAGVTAVSQTGGPETVLAGEAGLPYALLGYATDYANGVLPAPTPVDELTRHVAGSAGPVADALAHAIRHLESHAVVPGTGTTLTWC